MYICIYPICIHGQSIILCLGRDCDQDRERGQDLDWALIATGTKTRTGTAAGAGAGTRTIESRDRGGGKDRHRDCDLAQSWWWGPKAGHCTESLALSGMPCPPPLPANGKTHRVFPFFCPDPPLNGNTKQHFRWLFVPTPSLRQEIFPNLNKKRHPAAFVWRQTSCVCKACSQEAFVWLPRGSAADVWQWLR